MYFYIQDVSPLEALAINDAHRDPKTLAEEGFYIGTTDDKNDNSPSKQNLCRLERRLRKTQPPMNTGRSDLHKWFGANGQLTLDTQRFAAVPLKSWYYYYTLQMPMLLQQQNPTAMFHIQEPVKFSAENIHYFSHLVSGDYGLGIAASSMSTGPIYRLVFAVKRVRLLSHPLITTETRLCHTLEQKVADLGQHRSRNTERVCLWKLKRAHQHYLELKHTTDMSIAVDEVHLSKLRVALENIVNTRNTYEQEVMQDRVLEWEVLKTWDMIKEVRKLQAFTGCSTKLSMKKTDVDLDVEKQAYKEYMDLVMFEIAESRRLGVTEIIGTLLNEGEVSSPTKRMRKSSKSKIKSMSDDELRVFNMAEKHVDKILKQPGTPHIDYSILKTATTAEEMLPEAEKQRRRILRKLPFNFRLLLNEKEIARSFGGAIDAGTFDVELEQHFSNMTLIIDQYPRSLKMELWEKAAGLNNTISVPLEFPDPEKQTVMREPEWERVSFSGAEFRRSDLHDTYCQVKGGSSANLKKTASDATKETLRGYADLTMLWDVDDEGKPMAPSTLPRSKRLVLEPNQADPLDPRRVKRYISNANSGPEISATPTVMTNATDDDFALTNTMPNQKVLEILQLRHAKKIASTAPIPMTDAELHTAQLEIKDPALEATIKGKARHVRALTAPKSTRSEFLKRIRDHQLYRKIQNRPLYRPSDVDQFVREVKLPEDQNSIFEQLLEQNRPLKPTRMKQYATNVYDQSGHHYIVAQIVQARNLPLRRGFDIEKEDVEVLRCFVEINFQNQRLRTSIAGSANPQWSDTIKLDFQPPNFQPETLHNITDVVHINVFDETLVDLVQDDRDDMLIHKRRDRIWLGGISIPFSTLYEHSTIYGRLELQTPLFLFGYDHESNAPAPTLELFLTMEPPLPKAEMMRPHFTIDEDLSVLDIVYRWKLNTMRARPVNATAINLEGKTTLVTRYIRPLAPPASIDSVSKAARFVSMIPFVQDRSAITASIDLWCTSQQFIEIGAGDECEHAVLFCNICLYLKRKAFVVIGRGVPEGKSAYVLVEEDSVAGGRFGGGGFQGSLSSFLDMFSTATPYKLYNPLTGRSYSLKDPYCPLKEVYFAFSADNVWANIQEHVEPHRINFNLSSGNAWLPLFNSFLGKPTLLTIQESRVRYPEVSLAELKSMERDITQNLITVIEKRRGRFVTKWNRHASLILESVVPKLELTKQSNQSFQEFPELKRLQNEFHVSGLTVNLSFTDMEAIEDAVLKTDLHANQDRAAEFALVTHCYGYCQNVVSVWVYFCCVLPKR